MDMMITKHHLKIILSLALVFLISCDSEVPEKIISRNIIIDDLSYEHTFDSIPRTVVTLAPNLTEIVYALGLEDKLIGNTTYCNFPEEAKSVEKIGDILSINHEKLLKLEPDIIFITVEGNTKATFDKLKDLGLKVFISNPRNYEGIKKTFLDFGKIFSLSERADSIINTWNIIVDSVKSVSAKHPGYRTMFLVSFQPIMVAGKNTFINEFLDFCNLTNISSGTTVNYPFLSREEVLKKNPEIILHTQHSYDNISTIESLYDEWTNLSAVKSGRIYYVNPDLYFRPGPRFVIALKELNELLVK
jgi:iron complex transport system substrate-binding protein